MSAPFSRPYRSHRVPACDRCRHRKGRCVLDVTGGPCRFCRERNVTCNYQSGSAVGSESCLDVTPAKRQRRDETSEALNSPIDLAGRLTVRTSEGPDQTGSKPAESSIMMNSHMSEDIAVLEHYLSGTIVQSSTSRKPYSTISNTSGDPVVYLTVPRKRKGLPLAADPGRTQKEIIEQVLNPFAAEVRELYFDYLHPCFPILDETTFKEMWLKDKDRISSALLCDLYASASLFWRQSKALIHYPRPDLDFLWNTAVAALQDDFLAPTISTVHAALLDMIGRPVGAVTGNIINAGRVVTLAQSLGLHRDPSSWKVTAHEKHVRVRLWWGVLIHDHWSSVGHGTPPTVNLKYTDVQLPDLGVLKASLPSESQRKAASTFIELCKLTRILGDILPHIYSIQLDKEVVWRSLRKAECALDDWVLGLPEYARNCSSSPPAHVNGSNNLWFAYLSTKVLVCRLAFKVTMKATESSREARRYRSSMLREASAAVVDFITSLQDQHLRQFWLPYTSYLLVTATTVLLRCTIECGDPVTKKCCVAKLVQFRERLIRAKNESEWDLADFCLERCQEPIQKIADALSASVENAHVPQSVDEPLLETAETSYHSDQLALDLGEDESGNQFLQMNSLDYPWLWDPLEGPWDTLA